MLAKEKVVVVLTTGAAPIRRMVQDAREKMNLIDATSGHKTQSVIVTNSRHVVLSALSPDTISKRLMESIHPNKGEIV